MKSAALESSACTRVVGENPRVVTCGGGNLLKRTMLAWVSTTVQYQIILGEKPSLLYVQYMFNVQ